MIAIEFEAKYFPCDYCEQVFKQIGKLEKHVESIHNKEKNDNECEKCGKVLSDKSKLDFHVKWNLCDKKDLKKPEQKNEPIENKSKWVDAVKKKRSQQPLNSQSTETSYAKSDVSVNAIEAEAREKYLIQVNYFLKYFYKRHSYKFIDSEHIYLLLFSWLH